MPTTRSCKDTQSISFDAIQLQQIAYPVDVIFGQHLLDIQLEVEDSHSVESVLLLVVDHNQLFVKCMSL